MTPTTQWMARGLAVALAGLALLPVVSLGVSWTEYLRDVGLPLRETPPLGFDGVRWEGAPVRAAYVLPRGAAGVAGVDEGDRLLAIDFVPVAEAADAELQVERATGTVLTYTLERGGATRTVEVRVARYPTFLYPLSSPLWTSAAWGFSVVAFLHLLAYLTVAPLARRSGRAARSRGLIGAAFLWVGVNVLRIGWVAVLGPPPSAPSPEAAVFDGLTLVAIAGWIAYPALLLDTSLRTRPAVVALGAWRWVLAVPPVALAVGVAWATIVGHAGPLPPDAFAVPILFYVCVYVAAATGLTLVQSLSGPASTSRWAQLGTAGVCLLAVVGAALVPARLGLGPRDADLTTAWFVVAFQLFSLLPVALVSATTLRYGTFDALLIRGLSTVVTLALAFTIVVTGAALIDATFGGARPVVLGGFVVTVLLVVERAAPALRDWAQRAFQTQRDRARRRLDRFGDEVRAILDVEELATEAVSAVGEALEVRSGVVFVQAGRGTPDERWVRAAYRPEAPSFTEAELDRVWERLRDEGAVWSRNDELNEADLPRGISERLARLGAALAVPVTTGRGVPAGLIVLGRKARRLSVYNTADVDRLRAVANQIALAAERLRLLDRERALIRQTADAEMAALRAQINPHFLFNALNTVAALIRDQPTAAEATVEHLAGLFRDVLTASGQTTVPLRDELRLVRRYLAIEEARFGDALSVSVEVEPEAEDVDVPAFAVQTLVENAVKHGVERKRGGGSVTVRARRAAGGVEIVVADTGAGLPSGGATFGVGLGNVSARLAMLYDGAAQLAVEPADPGARATLFLPTNPPV